MQIFFVRHGNTEENQKRLYYGKTDTGLSLEGKRQMEQMAGFIKEQDWDAVYVSPLGRTVESARILLPDSPVIKDSRLEERNFGIFEGKSYEEIRREYPEESTEWEKDWMGYSIPGGESFLEVQERTEAFAKELLAKEFEKVLIVSHKGKMIQLLLALLGMDKKQYWKFTLEQERYSVIEISYGNPVLKALNQKV